MVVYLLGNSQVHWVKIKPALGPLLLNLIPASFTEGQVLVSVHSDVTHLHSTLSPRMQVQSLPRGPRLHLHSAQQDLLARSLRSV